MGAFRLRSSLFAVLLGIVVENEFQKELLRLQLVAFDNRCLFIKWPRRTLTYEPLGLNEEMESATVSREETRTFKSTSRSSGILIQAVPAICLLLSVVVAFATLLATVVAADSSAGSGFAAPIDAIIERFALPKDSLQKLKVRELKEMLQLKGATCDACVSKTDLIERIEEVKDWAVVSAGAGGESSSMGDETEDEKLAKLTETLAKSGIDTSKIHIAPRLGKDGKINQQQLEDFIRKMEDDKQKSGRGHNGNKNSENIGNFGEEDIADL